MIRTTLAHYRVLEKIGSGGMGDVYVAEDTKLGRRVALKVLPSGAASGERLERFEREAKALAALEHPNIVRVYSVEDAEGIHFITMELVQGETLASAIPKNGMRLSKFIDIAVPLADALSAAHEHGIIHRDLKPHNVMLSREGRPKILDFGLAKLKPLPGDAGSELVTRAATHEGTIVGTVAYMSPEQAEGKSTDHRSDIFSVGIILYEMVTGRAPFRGNTAVAVLSSILNDTPASISDSHPEVPRDLEKIIRRCLVKDVERRPQTAKDVRNALEEVKQEIDSGTAHTGPEKPHRRWGLGAAAAAGLALLVAGAALRYLLPPSPTPGPNWSLRPLTSSTGSESAATWSPDGSFIAYSATPSGNMDIFVMSTAGGDPVQLTDDPADDNLPRWSPDGRYLAFLSDRGTGTNVYLIPALGGAERTLVKTGFPYADRFDDVLGALGAQPWSPDGRELLFSRAQPSGESAMWKVNLATGEETQMTRPRSGEGDLLASWSFDGKWIAFVHQEGGGLGRWRLSAAGGEPSALLDEPYDDMQPAWSSDSRRLVFASDRGGAVSLWDIEIASGQLRQLTTGPWDWYPNVASSGKLAFERFGDRADLYWTQIDGQADEQLTSNRADNYAPRFSPDGKRVAFHSNRTGNDEIWLVDVETKAERQLTDHPATDMLPDWSPDGREIAFLSTREGDFQIWVMDLEGGAPRRLTEQAISVSGFGCTALRIAPRWSPDGDAIGYIAPSSEGMSLWVVDRDGKNARSYLPGVLRFDWYRDRRHVVYSRMAADGSGDRETLVADLESGRETTLHRGINVELSVARDGGAASYVQAVSHYAQSLYVLPLALGGSTGELPVPRGPPSLISRGTGRWHVHNGGWSPDGTRIVYTRTTDEIDLYVIENYNP